MASVEWMAIVSEAERDWNVQAEDGQWNAGYTFLFDKSLYPPAQTCAGKFA